MPLDELLDRMGSVELTMQFGAAQVRQREQAERNLERVHQTRSL